MTGQRTKIWTLSGEPSDELIDSIAALLKNGGVVLLPTDTIYGLHAVATNQDAIARIVALKGRDADKPLVVLGASPEDLETIGVVFPAEARKSLEEIWPAPLTAVLPLKQPVPASRGASSIGVRIPAVDWLRKLLAVTGPLASTSANRSGESPVSEPAELSHDLQNSVDAIVDAGRLAGEASTIVDFTGSEPALLRPGNTFFTQKVWKTLRKSL